MRSQSRLLWVSPLLFGSGFCAVIYQTTWLREFRLIFGASTAATAAVLSIFMGGIGLGSAILGRRSEFKTRPLEFYAKLELMIAAGAAATPVLLWMLRQMYLTMGGTPAIGLTLGTVVRLIMSALAIGLPTFLMGGTLPAAVRFVVTAEDANRRSVAQLYGVNTLGAVAGAFIGTFYFFEAFGNRLTLWLAVSLNVIVALSALWISKDVSAVDDASSPTPREDGVDIAPAAPVVFVYVAAAVAGFVFLLMELVWYRMVSPLIGGSTFAFGLILAIALFGIGLGALIYAFAFGGRRVSISGFALVCALEAMFIAIPYALGDRIALAAMLLRVLGAFGFYGHVMAWSAVCAVVTLPAALISGIQFPMLIALLGKGKAQVGLQTGMAYAWNTAGAIAGSLAGGFGLLPALSAPGTWRLAVILLCLLAISAMLIPLTRRVASLGRQIPAFCAVACSVWLLTALGPTAFWRHGQARVTQFTGSKSEFHDLENTMRRDILWDADGVESSVAMGFSNGLNFIVNGRVDGHATSDAGTQIMGGLLPAALHEGPEHALVIGLGTGSSAGWLAAVPSMKHVDVVELEPAILRVAEACAPVNHDALKNPKLNVILGDGREVLLSTREKYDVISSEPSNPYRAGVASLFTREFYEAVSKRLKPGGLFAQWVQAYEVDGATIETIYATLGSVFPNIDTWQTKHNDLLFVCTSEERQYDADLLRTRLSQEPFKSGILHAWSATSLEEFLAHLVANNSFAEAVKRTPNVSLNTDNCTVLEFAFARNLDLRGGVQAATLRSSAKMSHANRLTFSKGDVSWEEVERARLSALIALGETPDPKNYSDEGDRSLAAAYAGYAAEDFARALQAWQQQPREIKSLTELRMVAESMADQRSDKAMYYIDKLRETVPLEADAIRARLLLEGEEFYAATTVLEKVFQQLRTDPWFSRGLAERTLGVAERAALSAQSDVVAERLYHALQTPFAVFNSEERRRIRLLALGMKLDNGRYGEYTRAPLELAEPYVPWQAAFLEIRKACYEAVGSPRLFQAKHDLNEYLSEQPSSLDQVTRNHP